MSRHKGEKVQHRLESLATEEFWIKSWTTGKASTVYGRIRLSALSCTKLGLCRLKPYSTQKIQLGLLAYVAQIEYPIELVMEMMIAGFLDEDAVSFEGCKPLREMNFVKPVS